MRQRDPGNSNLVESVDKGSDTTLTFRSMPDPEDIYSCAIGPADTSKSFVSIPNVRDGDGDLIKPNEYQSKLVDGSIVMINCYMKLCVTLSS